MLHNKMQAGGVSQWCAFRAALNQSTKIAEKNALSGRFWCCSRLSEDGGDSATCHIRYASTGKLSYSGVSCTVVCEKCTKFVPVLCKSEEGRGWNYFFEVPRFGRVTLVWLGFPEKSFIFS
jgi:hypothetical protein